MDWGYTRCGSWLGVTVENSSSAKRLQRCDTSAYSRIRRIAVDGSVVVRSGPQKDGNLVATITGTQFVANRSLRKGQHGKVSASASGGDVVGLGRSRSVMIGTGLA
jgi:hypothetical protein